MKTSTLLLSLLFSLSISVGHSENDYLDLLDKNLYIEEAAVKMEVYKNGQVVKLYELQFYRKGERMRMEFTDPAPERSRRMLNDESSIWMYMPRTSKVIKLPFKQAFMGSDASNRDLMKLSFKKDYDLLTCTPKEDNILQLELKAKDLSVSYNKVIVLLDKVRKIIIRQEMYSLSGKKIKTIVYEKPLLCGENYIPTLITIKDELQKNTFTKMYYSDIHHKGNKPDEYYTLGSLKR